MGQLPILVVEDDSTIRTIVQSALEFEGYLVLTAENGQAALDVIARQPVSLILLDLRMPIVDGWTFANYLKRREIDIPIVVMTAERDGEAWAEEIEAAGYLAKPFDICSLLTTIASFYLSDPGDRAPT